MNHSDHSCPASETEAYAGDKYTYANLSIVELSSNYQNFGKNSRHSEDHTNFSQFFHQNHIQISEELENRQIIL